MAPGAVPAQPPVQGGGLRLSFAWALVLIGFAAVTLAAREHAWLIGHWSQDLSPVPLLAGIALLSTALDRVGGLGGASPVGDEASLGHRTNMWRWQLLGAALAATGVALLGRSGLALALAAAMAGALAITYATGPRQGAP